MHLNGTTDDLLRKRVFSPLSVLAALFVKIHIHLIGKIPHKLLETRTRGYYRENKWLVLMLASLAQNTRTLGLSLRPALSASRVDLKGNGELHYSLHSLLHRLHELLILSGPSIHGFDQKFVVNLQNELRVDPG